jgi:predicted Co/Zn/Cd cation transporter (cation efflux family)
VLSRVFYALLASATVCLVGGFVLLLNMRVVHPWGTVTGHVPSATDVISVFTWIISSTVLFWLSSRQGVCETNQSADSDQRNIQSSTFLTTVVLVGLGCGWTLLTIGGFSSKYIYPLILPHPPVISLICGLPIVLISILLVVLTAGQSWKLGHTVETKENERP